MTEQGTFYQFPEGFLWGSSTSGPQSEGIEPGDGKGLNNWDYWFGIEPERFHGLHLQACMLTWQLVVM